MNKKSDLGDILKRERERKIVENEKAKKAKSIVAPKDSNVKSGSLAEWEKNFNAGLIDSANDIRFYFVKDEYYDKLKDLYRENFVDFEKFGISAYKFLDYARESFERFKNMKKDLPLEPMNKKSYNYIESSVLSLLAKLKDKL